MSPKSRFARILHSTVPMGFLLLLAGLLTNALLTRWQLGLQVANQERLQNSHEVRLQLARYEDLLQDAETSELGFLYTGDARYASTYAESMAKIGAQMDTLQTLTSNDSQTNEKVQLLRALAQKKIIDLEKTMMLGKIGWVDEARSSATSDPSLFMMKSIRSLINSIQDREVILDSEHLAVYQRSVRRTVAYIYMTNLAAALGAMLLGFHIHKEMAARKRDAEMLRDREVELVRRQRLSELFINHAPAAVAMFDRQRRYLYTSRRWLSDYSLGGEDLRGVCHTDHSTNMPDAWIQAHERVLAGEVIREDADQFIRQDGTLQWIRWEMLPWRDELGDIGGTVIFSEDITKWKRDEEALRLSEERLRLANNVAGLGTFDVELPSGKRTWTPRVFQLFDLPMDGTEPGAEAAFKVIHPDDRNLFLETLPIIGSGGKLDQQYRIITRDGSVRWLEIKGNGIKEDGGGVPKRFLGILSDITERKAAEDALRRSEIQMRALAARVQSVTESERLRISRELHDQLGQALTGIKMDLNWIIRKHGKGEPAWVSAIHEIMISLDETVACVRGLSAELRPQLLDTLGLRVAVESECEQFERRTGVPCVVSATDTPLNLTNDQSIAAYRIFQEALTNIARHANAKTVRILLESDENEVILEIVDDGKGFAEEVIERTESLGLAGMRERSFLIGAEFGVASSIGVGTVITVRIPQRSAIGELVRS